MDLIDLIFPKKCLSCAKRKSFICEKCIRFVTLADLICPECQKASIDGFTHVKCRKRFGLDGLISIWRYEKVVKKALLKLKYAYAREIAKEIVNFLSPQLDKLSFIFPKNSVLVPIPLHFIKKNLRGFNQTELLGKLISEKQNWGFVKDLLLRKKLKQSQTRLKRKERQKNIKGVFFFNRKYKILGLSTQSVILFDDVYTTGSTLKEACLVLKRNGVKFVWGLTVAR